MARKPKKPKKTINVNISQVSADIKSDIKSQMLADMARQAKKREMKLKKQLEKEEAKRKGIKLKPKSKARKRPVKEMQKEFQHLQKQAMLRVRELRKNKMLGVSRAYLEALETKPKSSNTRRPLFYVNDRTSFKEIRKEIARIQQFLNDETSTIEGVRWNYDELELTRKYGGAFGRKWALLNDGKTFDPSRIDEEYARAAYKIFRYLEEMKGAYGLMYGEGSYDSESLIISIYDMVVERDIKLDKDGVPFNSSAENFYETVMDARAKLEYFHDRWSEQAKFERELGNTDTGVLNWAQDNIVVDLLQKSTSSRDFLKRLNNI